VSGRTVKGERRVNDRGLIWAASRIGNIAVTSNNARRRCHVAPRHLLFACRSPGGRAAGA
jgi:hypothetical protein